MRLSSMPDFLKPQDGSCLSIYLARLEDSDLSSNKDYLRQIRNEVSDLLRWSNDETRRIHFLNVIDYLIDHPEVSENQSQNVAVFVTEEGFWDFKFTGVCKPFFSLANSFHIKPLIRFLHRNRKFFLVDFEEACVTLYTDTAEGLLRIDSVYYPSPIRKSLEQVDSAIGQEADAIREQFEGFSLWIADWVSRELHQQRSPLVVTGLSHLARPFTKNSSYLPTLREEFDLDRSPGLDEVYQRARNTITELAALEEEDAVVNFKACHIEGRASTNLPVIAKEVAKDNVAILLVSKEDHIWGELDRDAGEIRFHFEQLTDLDDDVLDDLCEVALSQQARVFVLEKNQMPQGKPIAAIFKLRPNVIDIQGILDSKGLLSKEVRKPVHA